MPKGGLEPPRVAPYAPQTYVSTSSTTSASQEAFLGSTAVERSEARVPNSSCLIQTLRRPLPRPACSSSHPSDPPPSQVQQPVDPSAD